MTIAEFARLLEQVIKQQGSEKKLALIGIDDQLHLDPDYKSYEMEGTCSTGHPNEMPLSQRFHHTTINITMELPVDLHDMFAKGNAPLFPKLSLPLENMHIIQIPWN